jgi:hypothetical protein
MDEEVPKKEGSGKTKAINYDELDTNIQTHKSQALKASVELSASKILHLGVIQWKVSILHHRESYGA